MITRNDVTQLAGDWAVRNNSGAGAEIYLPLIQVDVMPDGDIPMVEHMLYLPVLSNMNGEDPSPSAEMESEALRQPSTGPEYTDSVQSSANDTRVDGEGGAEEGTTPTENETPAGVDKAFNPLTETSAAPSIDRETIHLPQISKGE
jgi:hypothetical protein